MPTLDTNIVKFKRTKRQPLEGDLFVCDLAHRVQVFGRVVEITDQGPMHTTLCLIYLYRGPIPKGPDDGGQHSPSLLAAPLFVTPKCFTDGYFSVIGNESPSRGERSRRHVFIDAYRDNNTGVLSYKFVDLGGGVVAKVTPRDLLTMGDWACTPLMLVAGALCEHLGIALKDDEHSAPLWPIDTLPEIQQLHDRLVTENGSGRLFDEIRTSRYS